MRGYLTPPLDTAFMNNSASIVPFATTLPAATGDSGATTAAQLWALATEGQAELAKDLASVEAFRLSDITRRNAWGELMAWLDIPCLWSNVGFVAAKGVTNVEVHVRGPPMNPMLSAHPVACPVAGGSGTRLNVTITYAPGFYDKAIPEAVAANFRRNIAALIASP